MITATRERSDEEQISLGRANLFLRDEEQISLSPFKSPHCIVERNLWDDVWRKERPALANLKKGGPRLCNRSLSLFKRIDTRPHACDGPYVRAPRK